MTHSTPIPIDDSVTDSMHQHEADRIYRALFGAAAPDVIKERFLEPSQTLNAGTVMRDVEHYYQALEHAPDLEALELACRWTGRFPLISRKFQLMVYLAETLPENQRYFVNTSDSFARGMLVVVATVFRSALKFVRGWFLMRRFNDE